MTVALPDLQDVIRLRKAQQAETLERLENSLRAEVFVEVISEAVRDRFAIQIRDARASLREAAGLAAVKRIEQTTINELTREVLAFLQAVALRRSGLDNATEVSQRMLNGLAKRAGVDREVLVAVDSAEFMKHTVSMIRASFPDAGVWRLPILVHELGHHVAYALWNRNPQVEKRPVLQLLNGEPRLHELFADTFATYTLGVAYPISVIALNASTDPLSDTQSATHPSWRDRIETTIAALRAISQLPEATLEDAAFDIMGDLVQELWKSVGGHPSDRQAELADRAADMVILLDLYAPRARYGLRGPTDALIERLQHPGACMPKGDITIAHVINAAWRWRLYNLDAGLHQLATVSDNALRWCTNAIV
ncbi:MAG: hypothetical protein EOP16_00435 [Pseudonocardia sp.]|nr:MAG: hypothetical protein EOP16_00435 [Pseudonocardia sp.]